jgi:uncharacterized protein (TIRG00374 family)
MARPSRSNRLLFLGILIALVLGALFFAYGDARKFLAVAEDVRPLPLVFACVFCAGAYLGFTAMLTLVARRGGYRVRFRDVVPTSFVSQAVNNLLSTGGIGGIAVRIYGFGVLGVPPGAATAVSAATTLTGDAVVAIGLAVSLLWLAGRGELSKRVEIWVMVLIAAALLLLFSAFLVFRNAKRRDRLVGWISGWGGSMAKKLESPALQKEEAVTSFRADLVRVFQRWLEDPLALLGAIALGIFDMTCRAACLGAAFWAIGIPQPPMVVAAGFLIGISAGAVSLIPGGIGVLEASMFGVFALLGVERDQAAVAVIVFRFVFYVLPVILTAIFFPGMMRPARRPAAA